MDQQAERPDARPIERPLWPGLTGPRLPSPPSASGPMLCGTASTSYSMTSTPPASRPTRRSRPRTNSGGPMTLGRAGAAGAAQGGVAGGIANAGR